MSARLSHLLERGLRLAAVLLLLALLGAVVTGVISRQLNRPVIWSDEMAQYLLVWTGFVGWMIAARKRAHIRIDIFINRLPRILRLSMEILIQLAMITFAVLLLRYGWPLVGRNWDVEWVSLPLSAGLLYLPIPFAALVMIGQAMVEIMDALRGHIAATPTPGDQHL